MPKRSSTGHDGQNGSNGHDEDINQSAARIVALTTGQSIPEITKNPAAVALGRLGGLKGGKARAEQLSAARRKQIAKKAAKTRWAKK